MTTKLLRAPLWRLAEKALGFELSDVQRAILEIGSGKRVQDLKPQLRDAAACVLGFDEGPDADLQVMFLLKGARGGGTLLSSILAAWRGLNVDVSSLAPNESARVAHLSASMAQARHGLRYARGFIASLGLEKMVTASRRDSFELKRDGKSVEWIVLRSNTQGQDLHGFNYAGVVIHEACLTSDPSRNGVAVDLDSIERSARPRLMPARDGRPAGIVIYESTARGAAGQSFELFTDNHGKPNADVCAMRATTLDMRPHDKPLAAHVARERVRDPLNARMEYDAEFLAEDSGMLFPWEVLDPIVDDRPPNLEPDPSYPAIAGLDLGFSHDSSSLIVLRRASDGVYDLCAIRRWRPRKGEALKPGVVIREALDVCEAHRVSAVHLDHHYREAVLEQSARRKLRIVPLPGGSEGKLKVHQEAVALVKQRGVRLGRDHLLLKSLMRLSVVREPNGAVRIKQPRTRLGHLDEASAFIAAASAVYRLVARGADPPFRAGSVSALQQALGIVDAEGRPMNRGIDFVVDELTGRARATVGAGRGFSDENQSQWDRGGF